MEQFQFSLSEELAKDFITGAAGTFLHTPTAMDEQYESLADLIKQTAWVSALLWKQRANLRFAYYDDLSNIEYSPDLKDVKTYREQEFPDILPREDAKVDMLVQPGVIASWKEDGEEYNKVWGQPLVLWRNVGEQEDRVLNNMDDSESDAEEEDVQFPDSDKE